jgi:hypothetical protein
MCLLFIIIIYIIIIIIIIIIISSLRPSCCNKKLAFICARDSRGTTPVMEIFDKAKRALLLHFFLLQI